MSPIKVKEPHSKAIVWPTQVLRILLIVAFVLSLYLRPSPESYTICSKSRNIYTVDQSNPRVECISIRGSRFVGVGNLDNIQNHNYLRGIMSILPRWTLDVFKLNSKVIQIDEKAIVVPGLADAHAHFIENGYMMLLPLVGTKSIQEVVERIKEYVLSHPEIQHNRTRWIEGMGWDQTKWPGEKFPTAAELDADPLLRGRLISLARIDGHARWVSPAVLDLIHNLPGEVDGGLIVRDQDGNPTGIFVDNAMNLIPVPPWSDLQVAEFAHLTIKQALSYGLTSIHDADTKPEDIDFFKRLADDDKLPIRLYLMGRGSGQYWGNILPQLKSYGRRSRLNFRSVKLFADGALGSWGAALLEPYSDRPETNGLLLSSEELLRNITRQYWRDGWQTNIHCIGDQANHIILDIYQEIIEKDRGNISEWRPRIEHAQIFTQHDLERIGKLGVIASVQPTHATSDMLYAETRLGPDRIKGAYAYQTLLQVSSKGVLPLGSDFPVEEMNPLLGFYAATTRLSVGGTSPHGSGGWFANQKLSRTQALKGMTLDAAYAAFAEDDVGSLTPGKRADFVVLDRDIMTLPSTEILEAKVLATVVDGAVVYGKL